jgi:serine/threonine-protein kinase
LPFADDAEWLKAVQKEKYPQRKYMPHIPDQVTRMARKSIRSDRSARYQTCLEFRQALQKIPLAVEWIPVNKNLWKGKFKNEPFEIEMYHKRTGFFIYFKRNGRKVNDKCFAQIPDLTTAEKEFFSVIRETTQEA